MKTPDSAFVSFDAFLEAAAADPALACFCLNQARMFKLRSAFFLGLVVEKIEDMDLKTKVHLHYTNEGRHANWLAKRIAELGGLLDTPHEAIAKLHDRRNRFRDRAEIMEADRLTEEAFLPVLVFYRVHLALARELLPAYAAAAARAADDETKALVERVLSEDATQEAYISDRLRALTAARPDVVAAAMRDFKTAERLFVEDYPAAVRVALEALPEEHRPPIDVFEIGG